jgi:Flp pilus assembly protein TadG
MNHLSHLALAAALTLGLAHGQAAAQAAAPAKPAPANATKPAPAKTTKPAPAKKAAPVAAALPAASADQLAAAERTHFGNYICELDQSIDVGMNPKTPGYVDVSFKKKTYTMTPIVSSTGAVRLEEVKGGMLLIQIANKSMMMDSKAGQRVVDGCVHEKQRAAAALMPKS